MYYLCVYDSASVDFWCRWKAKVVMLLTTEDPTLEYANVSYTTVVVVYFHLGMSVVGVYVSKTLFNLALEV